RVVSESASAFAASRSGGVVVSATVSSVGTTTDPTTSGGNGRSTHRAVDRALAEHAGSHVHDGRLARRDPVERNLWTDDQLRVATRARVDPGHCRNRITVCPNLHVAGERRRRVGGRLARPAEAGARDLREV